LLDLTPVPQVRFTCVGDATDMTPKIAVPLAALALVSLSLAAQTLYEQVLADPPREDGEG